MIVDWAMIVSWLVLLVVGIGSAVVVIETAVAYPAWSAEQRLFLQNKADCKASFHEEICDYNIDHATMNDVDTWMDEVRLAEQKGEFMPIGPFGRQCLAAMSTMPSCRPLLTRSKRGAARLPYGESPVLASLFMLTTILFVTLIDVTLRLRQRSRHRRSLLRPQRLPFGVALRQLSVGLSRGSEREDSRQQFDSPRSVDALIVESSAPVQPV